MKYKMMTAAEAVEQLFKPEQQNALDFTFDDIDKDPNCDISGWYGMKVLRIFDEEYGVFAMGYYGGSSTEAYDIYGMVDNSDDIECVKEYCAARLQSFMNTWCDSFEPCEKICVEIKED